jgi:hypothetical protein
MVIRCANAGCEFTRDRPLPVLTVDEAIYRRLPAFLIATVDKFAGLPWLEAAGAFFGHVDRVDNWRFYGAADKPGEGKRLWNGQTLLPPDLIIQDELHLISGPLGTVAALYEVALDRLASRDWMGQRLRPKLVASTATVRRAAPRRRCGRCSTGRRRRSFRRRDWTGATPSSRSPSHRLKSRRGSISASTRRAAGRS